MKTVKKILALGAALVIGVVSAFAQSNDDDIFVMNLGNASRAEFMEEINGMGSVDEFLMEALEDEGVDLLDFYEINSENVDEEDASIAGSFFEMTCNQADENDIFMGMAIRGVDMVEGVMDGWIMLCHYISDDDFLSYLFYFSASLY